MSKHALWNSCASDTEFNGRFNGCFNARLAGTDSAGCTDSPLPLLSFQSAPDGVYTTSVPVTQAPVCKTAAVSISDAFKTGMFKSTIKTGHNTSCAVANVSHIEAAEEQAWKSTVRLDANVEVVPETYSISMAAPIEDWMLEQMDEGSRGM